MTDEEQETVKAFIDNIDIYAPHMKVKTIKKMGFDENGYTKTPRKAHEILKKYKWRAISNNEIDDQQRAAFNYISAILLSTPEAQEEQATQNWGAKVSGRYRS